MAPRLVQSFAWFRSHIRTRISLRRKPPFAILQTYPLPLARTRRTAPPILGALALSALPRNHLLDRARISLAANLWPGWTKRHSPRQIHHGKSAATANRRKYRPRALPLVPQDRKSTRLNSSHIPLS